MLSSEWIKISFPPKWLWMINTAIDFCNEAKQFSKIPFQKWALYRFAFYANKKKSTVDVPVHSIRFQTISHKMRTIMIVNNLYRIKSSVNTRNSGTFEQVKTVNGVIFRRSIRINLIPWIVFLIKWAFNCQHVHITHFNGWIFATTILYWLLTPER